MRIVYFEFGHARVEYGSAASMALNGNQVYIVDQRTSNEHDIIIGYREMELGIDGDTKLSRVNIINPCVNLDDELRISRELICKNVKNVKPDILISGNKYWSVAKYISKELGIPLVYWNPLAFGIFKMPIFVKVAKVYSRIFILTISSMRQIMFSRGSDYTINNDFQTTKLLNKFGQSNVDTVLPTYTRFIERNAYSAFMDDKEKFNSKIEIDFNNYILSFITLTKASPAYGIESKALTFLKEVSLKMPNLNFVIVGTSPDETRNPREYMEIKNLHLIGKVYDDSDLSYLYKNSLCVVCPIYIPGYSNRLTEALFYKKPVISFPIAKQCFSKYLSDNGLIIVENISETVEAINMLMLSKNTELFQEKSRQLYLNNFHYLIHANQLSGLLSKL